MAEITQLSFRLGSKMLECSDLSGRTFLDIGSGSGLFSLAARRLGAKVHSFDYDPQSVACTQELKHRFFPDDDNWIVEQGSALDQGYLNGLGQFDIVYSWGVLHHTGDMWRALELVAQPVAPGGKLFIAIYNDQGGRSRIWRAIKRIYNKSPIARPILVAAFWPYFVGARKLWRVMRGRPLNRGMDYYRDMVDWLGGYPFEVARPESIFMTIRDRGYTLLQLKTVGGKQGCNEFVFKHREIGNSATRGR